MGMETGKMSRRQRFEGGVVPAAGTSVTFPLMGQTWCV